MEGGENMKKKIWIFLLILFLGLYGCGNSNATFVSDDYIIEEEAMMINNAKNQEKWEEIETFLEMIAVENIETIPLFYLYGSEAGYEKVKAVNYGYLPFYTNEDLEIIEEIVPLTNKAIRPEENRQATKYIVIHNTGMASPQATAKRLSKSINSSTRQASWHFTVDDREIYQQLGIEEIGWHAGAPEGNNYGIGIEMAVYQGIDLNQALRKTARLTAQLMLAYNLDLEDVKQHYDFSRKNCPQVLREANRWPEFLRLVEIEYYGQKHLADVSFTWKSLTPEIIDDQGKVINQSGLEAMTRYQVQVSYGDDVRTYTFNSKLEAF